MTESSGGSPPIIFCPSCGQQASASSAFCAACGQSLAPGAPPKTQSPVTSAPITPTNPTGASVVYPDHQPTGVGMAILWFLLCMPIGYASFGQPAKGWLGLLAVIMLGTVGIGALIAPALWVDYWFCFAKQEKRPLGEWEFFPTK